MAGKTILLFGFLAAFATNVLAQQGVPTDFEFSVTGELVKKLEPGTIISVSTLGTSKKHPHVFVSGRIEDLPLKLPVKDFRNR